MNHIHGCVSFSPTNLYKERCSFLLDFMDNLKDCPTKEPLLASLKLWFQRNITVKSDQVLTSIEPSIPSDGDFLAED